MLRVNHLTFSFKNRPLFDGLSFHVSAGQLVRIAGPNGAGKSTLMGLILGLLSGYTGHIEFAGDDDFRQWTSWIAPDANGLSTDLSAVENLRFWLSLRGRSASPESVAQTLESWGLKGTWIQESLPVGKFSTGMRRRLALARLELEDTRLWLLDEPLFGLDDKACQLFKLALERHARAGRSALIITHDERLLDGLAHQTVHVGGSRE
jgi:heme exporter protein A